MCENCNKLDQLIEQGLEQSGAKAYATAQDKELAESKGGTLADVSVGLLPLALIKSALRLLLEAGAGPQQIMNAVMFILQPTLERMGARVMHADGNNVEGLKEIVKDIEGEAEAWNKVKTGERWH